MAEYITNLHSKEKHKITKKELFNKYGNPQFVRMDRRSLIKNKSKNDQVTKLR